MPISLKSRNWKWFADDAAEPSNALAAENVRPELSNNSDKIRLRISVACVFGNGDLTGRKLQYSLNEVDWTDLGPTGDWDYANGQATEGNVLSSFKTTGPTTEGKYHEGGSITDSWPTGIEIVELDWCIQPTSSIPAATTYYFRYEGWDYGSGYSYPLVLTATGESSVETYPSSPMYKYSRQVKYRHTVIETDEFSSGADLDRVQIRFPKRTFSLKYLLTIADRDTIQNFIVNHAGKPFWFVDTQTGSTKKKWVDEYVGRGGPLEVFAAFADDNSVYTDDTIAANAGTANGMTLLPAAPVANQDSYYIGSLAQFDKTTITIGTQGAGYWTITWKYWNGSAWTALAGVTDGTTGFTAAAGARDVTFTVPTDWAIYEVNGINAYWIKADLTAFTSITIQPKGSGATINSKIFDLHGKTTSSQTIYIDGVAKTGGGTDYSVVSGGGAAGVDRITFVSYPAQGALITSDFIGDLRIKVKSSLNDLVEEDVAYNRVSLEISLREIQW